MEKNKVNINKTGYIRFFKGDGNEKNADAYRILRKLPGQVWSVTKFFDINNDDKKSTIKYHFGPIDEDYPLESAWNMNECELVDCQTLKDLVVLQLGTLKRHVHVTTGERALMHSIITDVIDMDAVAFSNYGANLYFSAKTGKFRLLLSVSPTQHLVVKFDEANNSKNFTIKYRTDTIEDISKYYSANEIKSDSKVTTLKSLHPVIVQILRKLVATYDDLTNTEEVTSASTIVSYKGNWSIHAKHVMSPDCLASWNVVEKRGKFDLNFSKPKSYKKEADLKEEGAVKHSGSNKKSNSSSGYEKRMWDELYASGLDNRQVDALSKLVDFKIKAHSSRIAAQMRAKKIINSKKRGVSRVFRS